MDTRAVNLRLGDAVVVGDRTLHVKGLELKTWAVHVTFVAVTGAELDAHYKWAQAVHVRDAERKLPPQEVS